MALVRRLAQRSPLWFLVLALVVQTVTFAPQRVAAQAPAECLDELSDAEVRARNEWLDDHFQAGKRRARAWWFSWIAIMSAISIGQFVLGSQAEEEVDRVSNFIGGSGAALLVGQLLVFPHTPAFAPQRFRRHAEATEADRRRKLEYGMELLERGATQQQNGRTGWLVHTGPLLWSSVIIPTMQVRYGDWLTTARMVLGGWTFTHLRIWSQPMFATHDWRRFRGMNCGGRYRPRHEVTVEVAGTGMRVTW